MEAYEWFTRPDEPIGTEPDQRIVDIAPILPYEYPSSPPEARSSPGDEQPDVRKIRTSEPYQRPPEYVRPTRPFIERIPEKPVAHVAPEQPVQQVIMSHPETVTLPPEQEVQRYAKPEVVPQSEVKSRPEVHSSKPAKPEEKSSDRRKNLPKPEEKASTTGSKNKKGRKFNGGGGRIHTEAHIDQILDEYLISGKLPSYVSDRQRYDYRHHIRLPERRQLLDKQQAAGNQASGSHTATGPKDNITHFPGTGTHDR